MVPLDFVLAVSLLTAPVDPGDTLDQGATPEIFSAVRLTLQGLAVQWEVLDPREVRYVLTRPEDFAADLKLLRRRYHDLQDAPPLCDCNRFPDRATVSDLLSFNRSYRQNLDNRQFVEMVHGCELREALQEADRLYQIWDTVRDARCDYYYVTVRRQALKRLRETVGPENYYNADLPPHVPLWRFQHLN